MSSFSDYSENLVLNWLFTTNAVTRPTAWFVALYTAAPSDTGGGTEVSGNGYARTATGTMTVSGTTTQCTNSAAIEFPANTTANWGSITHVGIFDASTAGNLLAWAPLTTARTINVGDVFRIPASNLTITLA